MTQGAAEPKPLLGRIVASALLMALLGWLLGLIYGAGHVLLTAIISGALLGLLGLRPLKLALGLVVGAVVGAGAARARRQPRAGGGRRRRHRRLSRHRGARLPQPPARPDHGRGGPGRRPGLRRALRGALALRRRRLRRAARRGARRHLPPQPARRRDPRLARQPARPDVRPGPRAPAHPRVLRAHQPLQALDRPRVAALDEAGLRGVQARRGRAARPGRDPVQHRGGPARDGEHDRHHRPRRRRGHRHPRVDPDLRGLGQADLRRHLHELPPRRARLRQRRLPDPELELHRHAGAPQRGRERPRADVTQRPAVPRPLPELGGQRARRADRHQAAVLRGAHPRLRASTASCGPSTASPSPACAS